MLGVEGVYHFKGFDQVADRLGLVTQQTRGHSLNNCHRSTAATPTQGESRGAGGSDATKDNENDNDDDFVEKHGISNDNESLCISDFSTLVQNNCNEFFNISKENDQLKTELKSYKDLCSKQENEIENLKKSFDVNLLTISKQLELLQKSLQKREKFIKKTIKDKDKIICQQQSMIQDLELRLVSSVGRDDADSGVVCTDTTDIDNDASDHSLKHSDSLKQSEGEEGTTSGSKFHHVASRRVYLNHRNITKMKDIKYKRITKTKSKSMEELRDKLRDSPFPLDKDDIGFSYA